MVEYKFPRLSLNHDYEPLIMALKGYHIAQNPRPFYSDFRPMTEPAIEEESAALRAWARHPTPLEDRDLDAFVGAVEYGLTIEAGGRLGHRGAYVDRMLRAVGRLLAERNAWLRARTG